MQSALNIGMVGCGNVGSGVLRALAANRALIDRRVPHPIEVVRVVVRNPATPRPALSGAVPVTDDLDDLIADPNVHVLLELTGTVDFARHAAVRAMQAGKHFVTANKALMATHAAELTGIAVDNNVCLLFEAAVGGGIPLIRMLHQGLAANDIVAIRGIINGTANYILTAMTDEGLDFETALQQAKELGYAEPDPTFDIEGVDTAHKLAILATLAFGQDIHGDDVYVEGITRIQAIDIEFARQEGYAVRLMGLAQRHDDAVEVRVHPTLLPEHRPLASVTGVLNAVRIDGNLTGPVILTGRGAGPEPTASAVISDLMALASGIDERGLSREMRLCVPTHAKKVRPMEALQTRYYIRFGLEDVPGSLGQVLAVLGRHQVSVASMEQPAEHAADHAHVLLMTHVAGEADLQNALGEIRRLAVNRTEPIVLRIEDSA